MFFRNVFFAMAAVALVSAEALVSGANPDSDSAAPSQSGVSAVNEKDTDQKQLALATFGGGCFWCTEAVFEMFDGVENVVSGYAGGFLPDPTYQDICSGLTGHAEVVQVTYDPSKVSYPRLLEAFWQSHNPTTLNQQGNDVGPQYRSIILYHNKEQKQFAEDALRKLNEAKIFRSPVVTEIAPLTTFYPAESKHQNFYQANKEMRYCRAVVEPKIKKIQKLFAEDMQPTAKKIRAD